MIDTFKQHVTPEQFINDGRSFKSGNKSDYISYLEFVKYFSDLTEIKKHNLINVYKKPSPIINFFINYLHQ